MRKRWIHRKHRILAMILAWALMLQLSGCGKPYEQLEPEPMTLSLWYYWDGYTARHRLLEIVNEFNDTHEDIQVSAKYVPDEDFKKRLALAIADGKAPDLAIVDSSDVRYYDKMNPLADMSAYMDEAEYLDAALASCRNEDGRILGLPLGLNCLAFYYNEDILEEKHIQPPENLDEFVRAAVRITDGTVFGCAFPSLQSEESIFCFLPILWAMGGNVTDIDSEAGRQAFDFFRRLARHRGMSHRTVNMTLSDITKEFAKGNIAMMFCTSGREAELQKANPQLNFKVMPIPTGQKPLTIIGGEVLTVLSDEKKQQATEFVRFLAEPKRIEAYLGDMMYLSPRKDILKLQTEQYPDMKRYAEYLETGRGREFTPYWPEISLAITDVINQVILEEDQVDTLQNLEKKIAGIREAQDETD